MKARWWIPASLLLIACSGGTATNDKAETPAPAPSAAPAPAPAPAAAPAPAPGEGEAEAEAKALTPEQLEKAKGMVHAMQPAAEAKTKLVEALGEPASEDGAGMSWFAPSGDKCKQLSVGKMGDTVATIDIKEADCPEPK